MTPQNPIIIVGGGLAGLSAAHSCYLHGANVVLVDKQGFLSGNSGKATSGINGALTNTQIKLEIKDTVEQFYKDTLKLAKELGDPELMKVLTSKSSDAIHWLQEVFELDLIVISRLGGHSQPRTHRGKDSKFPGMAITYKLLETLENLEVAEPHRVQILKNTQVIDLIADGLVVTGVKIKDLKLKAKSELHGPVIMATGGYAADFTRNSLLKKYRPDIIDLPSTNGEHATGDGTKIIMKNKGIGVDLDQVQVHPTGLIDYDATDVITGKTKPRFLFLGAEALRGEGGIILNSKGERFVNELGTRDYVSGEMQKQLNAGNGPLRLILTEKMCKNLEFHVKHYQQRNLMRKVSGAQLLKDLDIPASVLTNQFKDYNEKKDAFGKEFFPNLPVEFREQDNYYVSFITRVLHFTMGGVKIDKDCQVLNKEGTFQGLYACGELAGGVHGRNRLGGSSLLACVVFGKLSGDQASKYLLSRLSAVDRLSQIHLHIDPKNNTFTVDYGDKISKASQRETPEEPEEPKEPKADGLQVPEKEFTKEEVAKHNKADDCWCIVKNVVLDLTKFLPNHPGGADSILNFAGRDATESFDMLHEDSVVRRYAQECVLGRLRGEAPGLEK